MKRAFFITITALLFIISTRAQTTSGTEFWLTFGANGRAELMGYKPTLQIRIVCGELPTSGTINFLGLADSQTIPFHLGSKEVLTYPLSDSQRDAVYNVSKGTSHKSIYIQCEAPITAYAINLYESSSDATNLFPVFGLGTEYYQISYYPTEYTNDAYAVVATKDATNIYQDGTFLAKLNRGEVFYQTSPSDMTGAHITSDDDKPIAFFALCQDVFLPYEIGNSRECFMQQLAPVNTWGKKFFVPVSNLTDNTKDRVRIVASEDKTTFKTLPTGVTLITNSGGQSPITKPLQAGEFFELEVTLENKGCYFTTTKPVGVCTYLTSANYNDINFSDPSQAWLPSIEQTTPESLIVPFIAVGSSILQDHYALIIAPTATKLNTMVTIGNGSPQVVSGGTWHDNLTAGKSFYSYPMTNPSTSYCFTNPDGIIILAYGTGTRESYYYLAYSAMRNLQATFYVNDIRFSNLKTQVLCEGEVTFRAEISGMSNDQETLKWYIDDVEQTEVQDVLSWSKSFDIGTYNIKMLVYYDEVDSVILETIIQIGGQISTAASPPKGGSTEGDNCFKVNDKAIVTAIPNSNLRYSFVNWTENDFVVSTDNPYSFSVTESRSLVAHFKQEKYTVTIDVNNPDYGYTTGAGDYYDLDTAQVEAFSNGCYPFVNWIIDSIEVSTDNPFRFIITKNVNLVANFLTLDFDTCTLTLWNNTFLLNLRWLRENGYEVTGCRWFKNGIELLELNTIDEYSYCAGTNGEPLEPAPTYYTFQVNTSNFGCINSTKKMITQNSSAGTGKLLVYPNPINSGAQFTIEGVSKNSLIYVYNFMGVCVGSAIATDSTTKLTLSVPSGIYLIRSENKEAKIVIVE